MVKHKPYGLDLKSDKSSPGGLKTLTVAGLATKGWLIRTEQSSRCGGTTSAMGHFWRKVEGCYMHESQPLGRPDHRALSDQWIIWPAWLCQQNAGGGECQCQTSGEGSQRGKTAPWHEGRDKPVHTAKIWSALELLTNGALAAMELRVWTTLLSKPSGQRNSKRTAASLAGGKNTSKNRVTVVKLASWQWRHEPKSARHDVEKNVAYSWFDEELQNTICQRQ